MNTASSSRGVVLTMTLLALAAPARAIEGDGAERLEEMAEKIADARNLSVELEIAYDAVQADGRKLEFGETRRIALRRPDRARADAVTREGTRRSFVYDGKEIRLIDVDDELYAAVPQSGSLDAALRRFTQELGMVFPLSGLFSSELPKVLSENLREAHLVGPATIDGVWCDHIAARGDEVDLQVWMSREDHLPRRIVIGYRLAAGQPQFRADLSGWDLQAAHPDSLFALQPPEGSERLPILAAETGPAVEGGR